MVGEERRGREGLANRVHLPRQTCQLSRIARELHAFASCFRQELLYSHKINAKSGYSRV